MNYYLPTSLQVGEDVVDINSDFRCILDIIEVLNDGELDNRERTYYALGYFYPDFLEIPPKNYEQAAKQLFWFINGGTNEEENRKSKKLMDWEQDFQYIIGQVNKNIGHEIRNDEHLHWWTFLSAYMDIGECLFSQILSIRYKLEHHKKLDSFEKEWYRRNRSMVDLKKEVKCTSAEMDFMRSLSGGK